jgi:microsomal dipeptidase-like Zn-dependent dipeptidase
VYGRETLFFIAFVPEYKKNQTQAPEWIDELQGRQNHSSSILSEKKRREVDKKKKRYKEESTQGKLLIADLIDGMEPLHGQLVNINPHPLAPLHFHSFFILNF